MADVAAACRAADLALFVEPLGFDPATGGKLTGEARRRCVVETARRLMALGGDVLKAEFPYDPGVTDEAAWADACAELDAASPVPWVLLSGGVDDATFERQVAVACRAGASGVLVGRSVWAPAATLPARRARRLAARRGADAPGAARRARRRAGVPWHARRGTLPVPPQPGEGWYREY